MLKGIQNWLLLVLAVAQCGFGGSATAHETVSVKPALTVFLVRHSEKEPGKDPALTPEGQGRAQSLAGLLSSVRLDGIYSTDYRRTRETAEPTADEQGLPVSFYSPRELKQFAEQLKLRGGKVLVVGHSNTTPQLVSLLGGEAGDPIDEKHEFDRLYLLQQNNRGQMSTVVHRIGQNVIFK
ncbi:SixA phosphatase family protein [Ferrimonas futtsuensis]|uniref:SixA phosphatase family protein n=1 Tax=Ferrimonas futtsuensis TaxID=364764 RepID=UPI000420557B|nr:phosphoglycerate mutase family protein [Ferrimonas futtsuensis]